jgi:hypothetical protein
MKKFDSGLIGVDQGEVALFSDFENDGPMWKGQGVRIARADVLFSEPFLIPPSVTVGMTLWDFAHETNTRVDLRAEDVSEAGFAIVFRTWNNTRIARVRVGWQAIGPIRGEDDWVLI